MIFQKSGFWEFDHSCKWDQLVEPQHTHLILDALNDRDTKIERAGDGSYTLYSQQEALLVLPKLLTTRLLLCFYSMAINLSL